MNTDTETESLIFVYGTLKRGQINHSLIAPYALRIEDAEIDGLLFDVGDFPAAASGDGRIQGEAIWVRRSRVVALLKVLDRLEEYVPERPEASYYLRKSVEICLGTDERVEGYAYFYNVQHPTLPSIDTMRRVQSGSWEGPTGAPTTADTVEAYGQYVREFTQWHRDGEDST